MNINQKASEAIAVVGRIAPISQTAGSVSTGWVAVKNFHQFLAVVQAGVLGTSATLDAKIQQATDSSGTGVKDITGKAITQLVKASNDNNEATISFRAADVDTNNSFTHVRLTLTVGTATSLVAAVLMALPRYKPATALNAADVVESV